MAFSKRGNFALDMTGAPFSATNYQVPIDLTAASVVKLGAPDLFSAARSDGADIAIYDQTGSILQNFWLEYFTPGSSLGRLWVNVSSLPAGNKLGLQIQYADAARSTSLGSYDNTFQKFTIADIGSGNVLACFRYDDGSGTTPIDATGNYSASSSVNNGTPTWLGHAGGSWLGYNGSSAQNGVHFASGSAIHFNGSEAHLVTGLLDSPPAAGEIGLWFCPDSTINNTTTGFPHLFSKVNAGTSQAWTSTFRVYFDTDGTATLQQIYSATGAVSNSLLAKSQTTSWSAGVWHFLQVRWNLSTIELWIDGVLEASARTNQGSGNGQWPSGTANPFSVGSNWQSNAGLAFQSSTPFQSFTGYIYQAYVLSLEPKYDYDNALVNWRKYQAGMGANSRLTKYASNPVLAPSGSGWNGNLQIENSQVVVSSSDFRLYVTGWSSTPSDSLGAFTSTDGKTFSAMSGTNPASNPLISSGHGSNAIFNPDDGKFYWFYCKGVTTAGALYYRTSPDGKDWSGAETAVSGMSVSGIGQSWCANNIYNPWIYKDTNVGKWRMYLGGENNSNVWFTGLFESASLTGGGTWTVPVGQTNPTNITYRSALSSVSLQWVKILSDGTYVGVAHISSSGFGPTYGQHYYSADGWNWTRAPAMFLGLEAETFSGGPADQLADFRVTDFSGSAYVHYDVDRNSSSWDGQQGRIDLATTSGSSVQSLFTTYPQILQAASLPAQIGIGPLLPGAPWASGRRGSLTLPSGLSGAANIALTIANVAFSAAPPTVSAGVSVLLAVGEMAFSAAPVLASSNAAVTITPGTFALSAAPTVTAAAAGLAPLPAAAGWSAAPVSVSTGTPAFVAPTPAAISFSAAPVTVVGSANVAANPGTLSLAGVPVSPSGSATLAVQPASWAMTAAGVSIALSAGPLPVPASVVFSAAPVVINSTAVPVTVTPAQATIAFSAAPVQVGVSVINPDFLCTEPFRPFSFIVG